MIGVRLWTLNVMRSEVKKTILTRLCWVQEPLVHSVIWRVRSSTFLQVKSCLIEGMGDTIGISDKGTGCWGSAGSGFVIKWLTTCWRLRPLWLIFDVECCLIQGNVGLVGRDDGCLSSMASYLLVGYCTVSDMQVLPLGQCNVVILLSMLESSVCYDWDLRYWPWLEMIGSSTWLLPYYW